MDDQFKAVIQIAYDLAKGNKELETYLKKIEEKEVKIKASFDGDKVYKEAESQLKKLYDLRKQYASIQSPTKDEEYYYGRAIKNAEKLYQLAKSRTSEDNVYDFQKRNELELKSIQYEKELNNIIEKQTASALKDRLSAEKQIQSELKKTATEQQNATTLKYDKNILDNQITTYLKENTKLSDDFVGRLNNIKSGLTDDLDTTGLKNLKKEFTNIKSEVTAVGQSGKTVFQQFKSDLGNFTTFFSAAGIVMAGINSIRTLVNNVYELDTAMTNLYKVTNNTSTEYNNFLDNASIKAQTLGRSISSLVEQTAQWAQLGYNLNDASNLANVSSVYSNVGDVDDATAVSDLVSIMHAFNIEASDSITIVDKLNQVSNNYSVSAADLGTGLKNSASALNLAGNSIDQTIAMITAMNSVVQDASESGNALKVLSMRLRGATSDLEGIGEETDGVIKSVSTLRDTIQSLTSVNGSNGFDIMADDGNFKSTYEIMQGIAKVWKDISDVDQANLLQIIAGKQRGNDISALLTQMAQASDVLNTSLTSNGSAYAEQEKWLNSLQAKYQQLQSAVEGLSATLIDSDLLKNIVDFGTGSVNALNGLINTFGTLPTLIASTTLALNAMGKQVGVFKSTETTLSAFGVNLINLNKSLKETGSSVGVFSSYWDKANKSFITYNALSEKGIDSQNRFSELVGTSNISLGKYLSNLNGAKASLGGYIGSLVSAKAATIGLEVASIALNTAISLGLSLAIQGLVTAISGMANAHKEAIEAAKQNATEANSLSDNISNLSLKYHELSESVESNSSVKEDLLSTQDELLKALGIEESQIDALIDKYGSLDNAINQVTLDALNKAQGDLISGVNAFREDLLDAGSGDFFGNNDAFIGNISEYADVIDKIKNANISGTSITSSENGLYYLNLLGDDSTVEGILQNYDALIKAQRLMEETYTSDELSDNDFYLDLTNQIDKLKEGVDNYNNAISDLNKNSAQSTIIENLIGKDIPKTQEEFDNFKKTLFDSATASGDFIGSQKEISDSITNTLASMPEFSDFFKQISDTAKKASDSLSSIFNDDNADVIDKFQSSMSTIKETLSDTASLSSSDIVDLMQQFPELANYGFTGSEGIDALVNALKSLASEQYNSLDATLKSNDAFKSIYEDAINAGNSIDTLSDSLSKLSSGNELISGIKDEISEIGNISVDSLQKIISTYPQLESAVQNYLAGKITEKELLADLSKAYDTDLNNYKNLIATKNQYSESFYSTLVKGLPNWIKDLANAYGIDLENFKNLYSAKAELQKKFFEQMSIANTASSAALAAEAGSVYNASKDYDIAGKALQSANDIKKVIDSISTSFDTNLNFSTSGSGSGSSSKSGDGSKSSVSKYSQQLDLASEKIKVLQNDIDTLNSKLKNTTAVKSQIDIYKQLIQKQSELATAYRKTADVYQKQYSSALSKLSKSDQAKVKNGAYTIEQFSGTGKNSTDEKRYNAIQDAIELRDKLADTNSSVQDSISQLKDYAVELADIPWDKASAKVDDLNSDIDLLNEKLNNATSYEERNKILQEILEKQKEIVNEYKNAISDDKSDINSLFKEIDKNNRVNGNGIAVKSGVKITTKGITDPDELASIIKYNKAIDELNENLNTLYLEEEKLKGYSNSTISDTYNNDLSKINDSLSIIDNSKQDIKNTISEIEALDGKATKEQYDNLIKLNDQEISYYNQKKILAENALKNANLTPDETADYIQQIQEAKNAISDLVIEQREWNQSILEMPISTLEEVNEKLQNTLDSLNEKKDNYDSVISAVTNAIDDEIENIGDAKSEEEDYYDSLLENLQNELDTLNETNDEREKSLKLQQAQYDLEKAQNQKTNRVFREGQGFVYEADTDAVKEAQDTLDSLAYDSIIDAKQAEIDALEETKENALKSYDEQIDKLNEIKQSWEDIADSYEKLASIDLADNLLGNDWEEEILSGDDSYLNKVEKLYSKVESRITDIEDEIESNQEKIDSIKEYVKAWQNAQLDVTSAYDNIQTVVNDNETELETTQERVDETTAYGDEWNNTQDKVDLALLTIEQAQIIAKDNEKAILDERLLNLQSFANEVQSIAKDIAEELADIKSDLAEARAAQAKLNSITSSSSSSSSGESGTIYNVGKSHSGMELGYIGKTSQSENSDTLKMVALNKLKPDEVPRILKVDEAVLTKLQQENVLSNLANSFTSGIDTTMKNLQGISLKTSSSNPSFSIGEIHLHEVQNVDDLSNAITKEFLPIMNQKIYKK